MCVNGTRWWFLYLLDQDLVRQFGSVVLGWPVGCPLISPPPNRAVAVGQTTFLEYRTPGLKGLLHMLPLGPA